MFRTSLRSLRSRPLRTALTTLAILLGVAMIAGTYVLTDQISNGFNDIYKTALKGTAVQVTPRQAFTAQDGSGGSLSMPESLVATVRRVPGVGKVGASYEGLGAVLVNGKKATTGGAPTLLMSDPGAPFNNATTIAGSGVPGPGKVSVNHGFAEKYKVKVGDRIELATPTGLQAETVSGIFDWGNASSLAGTIMVVGTLDEAQRWFDAPGQVSGIDVSAAPGVGPDQLAARIRAAVPATVDVKTGAQAAADAGKQTGDQINSFLRPALLAFGGVSLFVGAFIIFNAFSITVAQRSREFAMLRALGASRRQVLLSVIGEALTMGIVASIAGLLGGLGVAAAINALFNAMGGEIPKAGLGLEPRTVVLSLVVGIGVALVASLVPALRATRVPPVAVLQEGATLPPSRFSRFSTPLAGLIALGGVAMLVLGIVGDGGSTNRLLEMGLGAVLIFVAVAMLAKYIVRPAAAVIGWPLQKLSRTSGRLARENAARNPQRTASTAAALMIGLAMVVFVAVLAQGLKTTFVDSLDRIVRADVVTADMASMQTVAPKTVASLRSLPGVQEATGIAVVPARIDQAGAIGLAGIDPARFAGVWKFQWIGSANDGLLAKLGTTGGLAEEQYAKGLGLKVGDPMTITAQNGRHLQVRLLGLYRDPVFINGVTVSNAVLIRLGQKTDSSITMVKGQPGTNPDALSRSVEQALSQFPAQTVYTKAGYMDYVGKQINQILTLLYALLAMSVTISLFGIVNTLVLSVYERTREIGMLRAVGTSRRQMRRIVRYESVITAVIGGILGTAVGTLFAFVVTKEFGGQNPAFSLPFGQLVSFLVVAVVVGVLAAVLPARRAARINVLEAIHYE